MLYSTSEEFSTIRNLTMDIIGGYLNLRKAAPTWLAVCIRCLSAIVFYTTMKTACRPLYWTLSIFAHVYWLPYLETIYTQRFYLSMSNYSSSCRQNILNNLRGWAFMFIKFTTIGSNGCLNILILNPTVEMLQYSCLWEVYQDGNETLTD